MFKLGKTPARPGAVKLAFSDYVRKAKLPMPADPANFGHESLQKAPWAMLGNDAVGDCVFAGAGHETMLANAIGGRTVAFNDKAVLSDYSAVTGYDPADPNTDQGTDMQVAASYRRKTGIVDASGERHKVIAYLALKPRDLKQLIQATYLFGFVGLGIEFPSSGMAQFDAGQPWEVVKRARIEGGHYVPVMGVTGGNVMCVTWGKLQAMTPAFVKKYADEAIAYVFPEALNVKGLSAEGFNLAQLQSMLAQVSAPKTPAAA